MKPLLFLLALTVAGIQAAPPAPAASGPVVNLPPMLVEGLGTKGPHWRYAAVPGYEILSCADDGPTEQFTLKLVRLDAQLHALVPSGLLWKNDEPTTLIFYPQSRAESLSREMMAELDRVQAARETPGRVRAPPNLDLRDPDSSVLFSIIDDQTLLPNWRAMNFTLTAGIDFHSLVLSPEHVASLVEERAPAPPPWFIVGFARFYNAVTGSDEGLRFGADSWLGPDEARAVSEHPDALRPTFPVAELFAAHFSFAETGPANRARQRLWTAEAELFVRWCVEGHPVPTGTTREALWRFVDASSRQPVTEALFRRFFGLGYADLRDELSDYLPTAVARPLTVSLPELPADPEIRLRDAPVEVIHRIKGDWARRTLRLVRASYPQLLPVYVQQARNTLQNAYNQSERDPRLVADLGLLYTEIGDATSSRRYLEEAFRAGPMRAAGLAQLALLRLAETRSGLPSASVRFTPAQVDYILAPVRAARRMQPPLLLTYSVAAETARRGPPGVSPELLELLAEGAQRFPSASLLVLSAGIHEAAAGNRQLALDLIDLGLWDATDPALVARLKSVRNALLPKPTK